MIQLTPPFFLIDGVSLLPDHADPLQWYFLPMAPRLTMVDGGGGASTPLIKLVLYRSGAGGGGVLYLDVNLGIDQVTLEGVSSKLQQMAKLRDRPRLAPVPVVDGTVKLLLLGAEDPPPDPPPAAGPRFVVKVQHAAKPALYGDNQATFSVQLDQYGATMLEQALLAGNAPVGVVYQLDFLALRPAFAIKCTIDWSRVQTHLEDSFKPGLLCSSDDLDHAIDRLVEQRLISVEVDTFMDGGADGQGIIDDRDRALNEVRQIIKSAFFESTIALPNAGLAGMIYKKVDLARIDQKSLNMSFNERTTVRRSIYPQGNLSGMFSSALRAGGNKADDFIRLLDLDDPFFQRRKVDVVARANFDEDSLASMIVDLKYGDNVRNIILEPSAQRVSVDWAAILGDNFVMKRPVSYHYQCTFKSVDRSEWPVKLTSAELSTVENILEIVPRDKLYSVLPVPIAAFGFPWDRYPFVEVHTKYDDDANDIHQRGTFLLSQQSPGRLWLQFLRNPVLKQFQYKLFFRGADHADLEWPWMASDGDLLTVRDPIPDRRSLAITPLLDWDKVDRAFVDITCGADRQSFVFTRDNAATKNYRAQVLDPKQRLSYACTIFYKDGHMAQVPTSLTVAPRLFVREGMKGHKIATVRPKPDADFAGQSIKEVDVIVRLVDAANGLDFNDTFTFTHATDQGHFEYDFADENKSRFEYQVTTQLTNGMSKSIDWTQSETDDLVVPVSA